MGLSRTDTSVSTSQGKIKACQMGHMKNHSRLQNFFEKDKFCSENSPVKGVFPLINLMDLTELPQLGGPDFDSVLDEER